MEIPRKDPGYRPVDERVRDHRAVDRRLADADLREQAGRCMDCGIPFCQGARSMVGCPVFNLIPEFNDQVYHDQWRDALELLLAGGCFPEFTGRICPAPCEASCVCGLNRDPVAIRQIELAVIEKAFERGYMQPSPPDTRRDERIAIVGSGPAGLAAAHVLNRTGFRVTVYENSAYPGGILRYGVPDFKLEKWVVERRIQLMEAEGIVFETGVEVGADVSYRFLKKRFDAILLTGGAREPRDLRIEGRELDGIHFAMQFLAQQNMRTGGESVPGNQSILADGRDVAVIGGGDTGSDCVGTSIRQGAGSVTQLEILPEPPAERAESTPWPLWPDQRRDSSSHKEGCVRRWSVSTEAFVGEEGRVRHLSCVEVEWTVPPGGKAPAPRRIAGSEFTVNADLVLLALGFVGPGRNHLVDERGLELDDRGFVKRDAGNMTSEPGLFVAGDMSQGASLVVRAIQDGRAAAGGITRFLDRGP
jgi:glutamate synthase (NADPH/NADH) small chain